MQPFILNFGKYEGRGLEEIALGKGSKGKSQRYFYFNQLMNDDPKYFGRFQQSPKAKSRWEYVHHKLNNFVSKYPCSVCEDETPTKISIAGCREYGYSMGRSYLACDDQECQERLLFDTNKAILHDLGFDAILEYGWRNGNTKFDEKELQNLMKQLAGWEGRLNPQRAADFIEGLELRIPLQQPVQLSLF